MNGEKHYTNKNIIEDSNKERDNLEPKLVKADMLSSKTQLIVRNVSTNQQLRCSTRLNRMYEDKENCTPNTQQDNSSQIKKKHHISSNQAHVTLCNNITSQLGKELADFKMSCIFDKQVKRIQNCIEEIDRGFEPSIDTGKRPTVNGSNPDSEFDRDIDIVNNLMEPNPKWVFKTPEHQNIKPPPAETNWNTLEPFVLSTENDIKSIYKINEQVKNKPFFDKYVEDHPNIPLNNNIVEPICHFHLKENTASFLQSCKEKRKRPIQDITNRTLRCSKVPKQLNFNEEIEKSACQQSFTSSCLCGNCYYFTTMSRTQEHNSQSTNLDNTLLVPNIANSQHRDDQDFTLFHLDL